ncbi:MAG TPA: hypothetical protein VGS79_10020 [Puia sp.]|nr:hypothetical protein [Puia sp.]
MRILLFFLGITTSGMVCNHVYEGPFYAKISCEGHKGDCKTYVLPNGLQIEFNWVHYYFFRGKGATSILCNLINPYNAKLSINRDEFTIASSKGIQYLAKPFTSVDSPRTMFERSTTYPSVYTVEGNRTAHYVFSYCVDKKYTTQQMQAIFKTDVVYFLHTSGSMTDTLFQYVADDRRLR